MRYSYPTPYRVGLVLGTVSDCASLSFGCRVTICSTASSSDKTSDPLFVSRITPSLAFPCGNSASSAHTCPAASQHNEASTRTGGEAPRKAVNVVFNSRNELIFFTDSTRHGKQTRVSRPRDKEKTPSVIHQPEVEPPTVPGSALAKHIVSLKPDLI